MKTYVVTSGCYSDYHIDAVFTVKEKAEEYVKYNAHNTYWNEMRIEEYDTSDNYSCDKYITVKYRLIISEGYGIKSTHENGQLKLSSCKELNFSLHDIDVYPTNVKQDLTYLYNSIRGTFPTELTITRSYNEGLFTEEEAKNKVLKIGNDLCIMIKNLFELEGYALEDIADYINNDVDK